MKRDNVTAKWEETAVLMVIFQYEESWTLFANDVDSKRTAFFIMIN